MCVPEAAGFVAGTGRRVIVWQIPMGNTLMRATNDTTGHYADNRPEFFLDDVADGHLAAWRDAGVVGLLFGGGADGTTCACDAMGDGVTNPAASGTHTRVSLNADDDGGYLHDRVAAYYAGTPLPLQAGAPTPTPTPTPAPTPPAPTPTPTPTPTPGPSPSPPPTVQWSTRAAVSRTTVHRGGWVTVTARVTASAGSIALVDLEIAGPNGRKVGQRSWSAVTFTGGATRTLTWTWHVSTTRPLGLYTVRIGVFTPGWSTLEVWNGRAAAFHVAR